MAPSRAPLSPHQDFIQNINLIDEVGDPPSPTPIPDSKLYNYTLSFTVLIIQIVFVKLFNKKMILRKCQIVEERVSYLHLSRYQEKVLQFDIFNISLRHHKYM